MSQPDIPPSVATGEWMPSGQVFFEKHFTNTTTIVTVNWWGGEQLLQAVKWASQNGLTPLSANTMRAIDLYPKSNGANEGCPDHGTEYLRTDKKNRGKYCCFSKPKGGYCGWQSWK